MDGQSCTNEALRCKCEPGSRTHAYYAMASSSAASAQHQHSAASRQKLELATGSFFIASARLLDRIKPLGQERARTKPWPPWPTTTRYATSGIVASDPVVEGDIGFEDFCQCYKRILHGRRAMPQRRGIWLDYVHTPGVWIIWHSEHLLRVWQEISDNRQLTNR